MPPSASSINRVIGDSNSSMGEGRAVGGGMAIARGSMEIARLRAQATEHGAQVLEVAGDEVFDAVHALPAAAHGKQGGVEQGLAATLRDARPDDHVDHAVLVLQRDEDRAAGGPGALALGDDAGG